MKNIVYNIDTENKQGGHKNEKDTTLVQTD